MAEHPGEWYPVAGAARWTQALAVRDPELAVGVTTIVDGDDMRMP